MKRTESFYKLSFQLINKIIRIQIKVIHIFSKKTYISGNRLGSTEARYCQILNHAGTKLVLKLGYLICF